MLRPGDDSGGAKSVGVRVYWFRQPVDVRTSNHGSGVVQNSVVSSYGNVS